jgi:hypothetical protein
VTIRGVHRENAMIEIPVSMSLKSKEKDIQSMGELSATTVMITTMGLQVYPDNDGKLWL